MLLYPVLMLPCRKIMKSLSRVRKILSKVVWQFKGKNSEGFVFFSPSASNQLIWFFKPLFSVIFSFFFRSVEITLKCDESQYPGNTGSGVTEFYEPKNSAYVRFWRIIVFCSFFGKLSKSNQDVVLFQTFSRPGSNTECFMSTTSFKLGGPLLIKSTPA